MLLMLEKCAARIGELEPYRYRDERSFQWLAFEEDPAGEIGTRPVRDRSYASRLEVGDRWAGRDVYAWLHRQIDVPREWEGKKAVGLFDFGITGGGNNSGFESLLYLNGKPYQGVDSNHREVFLPEGAAGGSADFVFRLWSGLEGGGKPQAQEHRINKAAIAWLDEAADDLYYSGKAIVETVKLLDDSGSDRASLLTALDRALLRLDWSRPGSDAFYDSVLHARDTLDAELSRLPKLSDIAVHCIGHTHIDVAWLWRLKHTREKSARSFSTVLRLMEQYPEYTFLQTQPQLYEYIKEDYPDIYEGIKERVKEGRWEAAGGMWLEADCNLTSGESLVRQLLYGTRFLRDEFGVECTYLWLPDVFGYSWALPQILRKSGIDTFMTTKISWNQYNRMPHDTFRWKGIDGSEVLTHFITTPDSWEGANPFFYTYNGQITPRSVKGIWTAYRDKEMNRDLLLSYGYGDGGGGVNREMLEMRRRLDRLPGLPNVKTGRADDYFRQLHKTVNESDRYIHTWDGELYLEYHRGTYTSQAYNKRMNRKLELLSREAEWLNAWSCASGPTKDWSRYPAAELLSAWKILLRNQFHDIIPGSSIREVYEDSTLEYGHSQKLLQTAWDGAARALSAAEDGAYTLFNSSAWERSELVHIEGASASQSWTDERGNLLPVQATDRGVLVRVDNVPALGAAVIRRGADGATSDAARPYGAANGGAPTDAQPFVCRERGLTTPFYELEWNERGQLVRIYDRKADRDVLAPHERGNVLQLFEDKPLAHDAWDIDIFYREKMTEIDGLAAVHAESGPLRAVVAFEWRTGDSVIKQNMILYAHSARIDFETEADWRERQRLLKVAFPVRIRATEATYDIQFGNVKRPTHWNTSWDWARFESVGQQWADLSERNYGVSLLNDCKYGYDIKGNVMRLSLLTSSIHPDVEADQGYHRFTYSLLPHRDGWLEAGTVREAWQLNAPLAIAAGALSGNTAPLFAVAGHPVMIDAVKKAEDEDAVVIRLHEYAGGSGKLTLALREGAEGVWHECDLLERPAGEGSQGNALTIELAPYEIRTLKLKL